MSVRLELLGPPRVWRDDTALRFDTRKAVALLAYLAVTGRDHGRDALAALLWPDLDRAHARATLRRTLSVAAAVGPDLDVTGDRVALTAGATSDVDDFRRLAASDHPGDWARAAALPADRFLDGFALRDSPPFDDWVRQVGDELRDGLSRTLARLVRTAIDEGRWEEAQEWARGRVRIDPLSEPAHADLIRATALAGDRPGALHAYRVLVRLLDTELGVAPLADTLALHEDIRTGRLRAAPAAATERPSTGEVGGGRVTGRPRLVGRERELRILEDAWTDVAGERRARLIGLVGEPGIGKTAIAEALAEALDESAAPRVVRVTGRAAEASLAYAAATDLVRGIGASLPEGAIRTPGDLQRVHEAVRAALERLAAEAPVLLIVDVAEQIDRPSAVLLGYLAHRLPEGILMLVCWRPGTTGGALQQAVRDVGEILTLAPLDAPDIEELVGESLDAGDVLRRTRGIPLLVHELAAAPTALGHAEVRDIVAARLAGSSETTTQVVAAAVVIGRIATPELLRAVSGRDESETVEAIEEAVDRSLLVEHAEPPGYDVPHDLVREAALGGLSLARRRLLHARVADIFARSHSVDPLGAPAGAVAQHLAAAGRDPDAADWFVRAAADAARLGAHEEAIAQLRSAVALGRRDSEVHAALGAALVRLGRYDEALIAFDQASAAADDADVRATVDHAIARVHDRRGEWGLAQSHLESAVEAIGGGDLGRRARVLADLALVLHRRGLTADARATAASAQQSGDVAGDTAAAIQAMNVLGMIALADGDQRGAEEELEHAVARAEAHGDDDLTIAALNNLARARATRGAADEALAAARDALRRAQAQGDRHRQAALHSHLADLLHAIGREEEAMAALRASAIAFSEVQGSELRPEVWTLTEW